MSLCHPLNKSQHQMTLPARAKAHKKEAPVKAWRKEAPKQTSFLHCQSHKCQPET